MGSKPGYYGDQKGKPSQYKIAMDSIKKEKRDKARAKKENLCGVTKRSGTGKCRNPAGHGTDHPGVGKCRIHGGTSEANMKHAAKLAAKELMGSPMEINPYDAILWCIRITAGQVQWLSNEIAQLEEQDWTERTLGGRQFHLYVRERRSAMQDLARYSAMAVSLGIAERAIKLAETYGELLAHYTKGLLNDLWPHLDEAGRTKAPGFVRLRLVQLDRGREPPIVNGATIETDADIVIEDEEQTG